MTLQIYQFRLCIVARFTIVQIKWCSGSRKSHLTNFKTLYSILKFGSQRCDVSWAATELSIWLTSNKLFERLKMYVIFNFHVRFAGPKLYLKSFNNWQALKKKKKKMMTMSYFVAVSA
jgi:hypothetical protein